MTNELMVKYKWQGEELQLSRSIVRNRIATSKNVTDKEVDDFIDLCVYKHLNPYLKEAYLIKYGQEPAQLVTSKDIFDLRASLDPDFDGEEITNNYKRGMNLMDLWVRTKIFAKGCSHPAADVTVHYSEYVGKKKDGTIIFIWRTKPVTMLTKVSKAQGKREANPKEMARLYLAEEFDQQVKPTESVIREIDITPKSEVKDEVNREAKEIPKDINPKSKHRGEAIPMDDARDDAGNVKEAEIVDRNDEAIEEAEVIETEKAKQEADEVPMDIMPASDKQKDYIYGLSQCKKCKKEFRGFKCPYCGAKDTKDKKWIKILKKGIIHSDYIETEEIIEIGFPNKLDIAKASEKMKWWWGDKDKNIVGEREKREKNPKTGESDLERRSTLMREVLALMKKNYIHKPMQKKFYKKFKKDDIKELTTEELVTLKGELEHYVPDWK